MADFSLTRHLPIFDPSQYPQQVHIIGCGATGSRVFAALVELGVTNISCYDPDIVEGHNLANQLFGAQNIESFKVDALARWYKDKTGFEPPPQMEFHKQRVDAKFPAKPLDGFVFLLTDTMASRKEIFDIYLHDGVSKNISRVIETRMAAVHGNVLHFDPNKKEDVDAWLATLTTDETTEVSSCGTSISVGTTASLIANLAVQQYMWLCANPAAADPRIDIYCRPFIAITGVL